MSGLTFGGIAPHGFSIIKEIAGNEYETSRLTAESMKEMAIRMQKYKIDTIVILTPHNLRIQGYNAIVTSEYCIGSLSDHGNSVSLDYKCDQTLAKKILNDAVKIGIPCVGVNYGALSGRGSNVAMDWGTLIPLYFLGNSSSPKPEIVVIGPTREIPLEQLVKLGQVIANAAKESGKAVALIASADQGHAHDANGVYGLDPASQEYDNRIIDIIRGDKLEKLLDMDLELVERAKPDSLWQMLILYGATKIVPMRGEFISYQVPSYFGMLVASYEPI